MPEKSFWENLGRGAAYAFRKAKQVGDKLSDEAEGRLDLREARETLERRYLELGRHVASLTSGHERRNLDLDEESVRELLEEVRAAEKRVTELEAKRGEEHAERRESEKEPPRADGPPDPDSREPDSAES